MELNNAFNTMVSTMLVGLDMAPTPTQIATKESDRKDLNRTTAAWPDMQQQITLFSAVRAKNNQQELKLSSRPLNWLAQPAALCPQLAKESG
jgi:hypothetical protein